MQISRGHLYTSFLKPDSLDREHDACMSDAEIIATIRNKYQALSPVMDEHVRRRWAACEALAIGWGGITAVAKATGLAPPCERPAEVKGARHRAEEDEPPTGHRVRRSGGGRRRVTERDRTLLKDWQSCWRLPPVGTRSRLCYGPARALVTLPMPWCTRGTT